MKGAFGNSCAKGCMVYFVALAAIVGITMFGLGGLSARFGGSTQQPASVQGAKNSQQSNADVVPTSLSVAPQPTQAHAVGDIVVPTPATAPPLPAVPTLPVQPTVAAPAPNPADSPQVAPQAYTPLQVQDGVITGEASTPFYVVQPGDTLSQIAQGLQVDVNALVSVNNLADDLIYPDQVLYLPFDVGGQAPPPSEVPPQPQQPAETPATQGGPGVPVSPVEVVPTAVGTDAPTVPEMPNTGINKKR
ncbi:MAG: LysM peptidoglycan-binding domain-containing protein [Chloroflexota bacterium]|nr:LysM peptidoglycan-binding domain-containing protein [Chloroflexota bacterium]